MFSLLMANFGAGLALPTDLPYCLVYPVVFHKSQDKTVFNTHGCPPGFHTSACVCHKLLHPDPASVRLFSGGHLLSLCRAQFETRIFPCMSVPRNYATPLADANTGKPYPMVSVGISALWTPCFLGPLKTAFCTPRMTWPIFVGKAT